MPNFRVKYQTPAVKPIRLFDNGGNVDDMTIVLCTPPGQTGAMFSLVRYSGYAVTDFPFLVSIGFTTPASWSIRGYAWGNTGATAISRMKDWIQNRYTWKKLTHPANTLFIQEFFYLTGGITLSGADFAIQVGEAQNSADGGPIDWCRSYGRIEMPGTSQTSTVGQRDVSATDAAAAAAYVRSAVLCPDGTAWNSSYFNFASPIEVTQVQ